MRLRSITLLVSDNKIPSIFVPPKSMPIRFIIIIKPIGLYLLIQIIPLMLHPKPDDYLN